MWADGDGDPDHVALAHQRGEPGLVPARGAFGAQRQHHPAVVGGAVDHADRGAGGQHGMPFGEHALGVADGTGTVGGGLEPERRVAEHAAGVAAAQRADDQVVGPGRVLEHAERWQAAHGHAHRFGGGGTVGEQGGAEIGVGPGAGDHGGPTGRAGGVGLGDALGDLLRRGDRLFVQQAADGGEQAVALGLDERGHAAGSSQGSKISTTISAAPASGQMARGWKATW